MFYKLKDKELPEAWCIMATFHSNHVWVYWTRVGKMDDNFDKREVLSIEDFNNKYVRL